MFSKAKKSEVDLVAWGRANAGTQAGAAGEWARIHREGEGQIGIAAALLFGAAPTVDSPRCIIDERRRIVWVARAGQRGEFTMFVNIKGQKT